VNAHTARQGLLNYLTGRAVCQAPRPVDEAEGLLDAYRAEVLREGAALVEDRACDADFTETPHHIAGLREAVELLTRSAGEKSSPVGADAAAGLTDRQTRLLDAIRTHGGAWNTRRVLSLYALTDPGVVQRGTARLDLAALHRAGHLALVDDPDNRHYALHARKDRA
jgi:hypothetical protein